MANGNSAILTVQQEQKLRQPIEDYVGGIQKKIDSLRADGTDRVPAHREEPLSPPVPEYSGFFP